MCRKVSYKLIDPIITDGKCGKKTFLKIFFPLPPQSEAEFNQYRNSKADKHKIERDIKRSRDSKYLATWELIVLWLAASKEKSPSDWYFYLNPDHTTFSTTQQTKLPTLDYLEPVFYIIVVIKCGIFAVAIPSLIDL